MTEKELKDTIIVTGWKSAYIAKRNKSKDTISQVRREITESEILGLIAWYSQQKFERDNCDEYSITDENGDEVLIINKPRLSPNQTA